MAKVEELSFHMRRMQDEILKGDYFANNNNKKKKNSFWTWPKRLRGGFGSK